MIREDDIAAAAKVFSDAAKSTSEDFAHGDVAGEEDFSGQFIGRLKAKFEDFETKSARWRVGATVTEANDGPIQPTIRFSARQTVKTTEEPEIGADIIFALEIHQSDYVSQKGVLVQAKRLTKGAILGPAIATKLRSQCSDMLDLSPASFVFLYSLTGVTALSATIVEGSKRDDLHALEQWPGSARIFFMDFVKCWIGDPRLKATDKQSLAVLRQRIAARNAVLLEVEARG